MGQKATYRAYTPFIATSFDHIIVQNNYHQLRDVSSYVYKPTGNAEKDREEWAILVTEHTVALFRFKPKAKAIDLGETI